jgi:ribosome modulation factor
MSMTGSGDASVTAESAAQVVTSASLRAAYEAGRRARFGGRRAEPPPGDATEAHAWLAGWRAADSRIFASWPG